MTQELGIETYKRQFSAANTRAKNLTLRLYSLKSSHQEAVDALKALIPLVDHDGSVEQAAALDRAQAAIALAEARL